SRKTLAFWASIVLPVIICGLVAFGFYNSADKIVKFNYTPEVYWFQFLRPTISIMGTLILPFYIIFMAFSVNNLEHKNDTWKTLFAQPLNKLSIYSAKYFYGLVLIFICLFLFFLLSWLAGLGLSVLDSRFGFNKVSPVQFLSSIYFRTFLSALGIFSIQFILSLVWGDFLKPMGIGFVLTIAGMITTMVGWKHAWLIPYGSPIGATQLGGKNPFKEPLEIMTDGIWVSIAFAAVLYVAGYYILSKRNIK
ncbi:MAG: ABC transporter permease, partial [Sphingobacteriales bacterium]